jgi:CheY-like chemotaxis protein
MLRSCQARVASAASADEAIRLVEEVRPDVLVSDIGMPEQDGYALIQMLRALPESRGGRTPAIALTAYARLEDRMKALVAGFNMHVSKPVEPTELVAVIVNLTSMFRPPARETDSLLQAIARQQQDQKHDQDQAGR